MKTAIYLNFLVNLPYVRQGKTMDKLLIRIGLTAAFN